MNDSRITVASRRTGLAAAATVSALAIVASPGACQAPDPIHAAVTHHVSSLEAFDLACADCGRNMIPGLSSSNEQMAVADAAYRAKRISIVASMTVAETVPTTEAGRQALADHLLIDRYRVEIENGRRLNAHAARTGERFTVEFEIVDAV